MLESARPSLEQRFRLSTAESLCSVGPILAILGKGITHPTESRVDEAMFHFKLIELESELLAKELAGQAADLTPECEHLLDFIEREIGLKLASRAQRDWRGWISYRRQKNSLVILRGRTFPQSGMFVKDYRVGLDVPYGQDAITEYLRNFDITPPQELDHILINFRPADPPTIMVWYGENIAPYQLYFEAEASLESENQIKEAVTQGCAWILTKPKDMTLAQFLQKQPEK